MNDPEKQPQAIQGIPIVSAETLKAIESQYSGDNDDGQTWGDRLAGMRDELVSTNPNLTQYINKQIGSYPEVMREPVAASILGTLILIDSQTKANELELEFPDLSSPDSTE